MSNTAELRQILPAAYYRPNKAATPSFIEINGGSSGSRSKGDGIFFETEAQGRAAIGGNRAGKTTKLVLEAISWMLGMRPWYPPTSPWHKRGLKQVGDEWGVTPARVRYVVPNFGTHLPEVVKELSKWLPQDFWEVISKSATGEPREIRIPMTDSRILFMSQKQDKEDFEGIEADLVCWDEPPPKEKWVALNRGLVSTGGRWCVGATLLDASGWFWDEVVQPNEEIEGGDVLVSWHSIWDNTLENGGCPTQPCRGVRQWLGLIADPDEKAAREHGAPMHIGGLVISGWKDAVNLVEPFDIPKDAVIISCIDPAGSKPFAGVHIAYVVDEKGWTGYIFDETYITQSRNDLGLFCRTWQEKEAGKLEPRHPRPSDVTLIDPWAEGIQKADHAGRSMRRILDEDYGIKTVCADRKDKRIRLIQLNARVRSGNYKVFRSCRRLLDERRRWSWDPTSAKQVKGPDDCWDCVAYIDALDPPRSFLKTIEGEEEGGVWRPNEYRERDLKAWAKRNWHTFGPKEREKYAGWR